VDTNEHWGYINARKVRGWVNDYQILHRDPPSGNAVDLDAIRDVFSSNFGLGTGYADTFRDFSQSFQGNAG
jgi:hypothetical protein